MKLFYSLSFQILILLSPLFAQSQFDQFLQRVNSLPDSSSKAAIVDSFISVARIQGIPFIENNTANYFLRGSYNSVEITGDFNEFAPYLDLTHLSNTNFFYYSAVYESNARLDYEYRIDGTTIINDPENPDSIPGYYGYNSELAMPDYIHPYEIEFNSSISHGSIISTSVYSSNLNRTYQLKIYLPAEYSSTTLYYPTVYFQDGLSYIDWGKTINVLENIIALNKIKPVIAIFVVPTDRNQEYAFGLREEYSQFFVNELVPYIDNNYRTITLATERLVIGDSYGGNISALISYNHPDIFANCGLQSAALHSNNYEVYNLLTNGIVKNIKFSTVWGSYDDRNNYLTTLKDSLISKGYLTDWYVLPEGHSWGLWRATVDTMLQYFFPPQINDEKLVTINTDPAGIEFIVDSIVYNSQQVFSWALESVHSIGTVSSQNPFQNVRYLWDSWSDNDSLVHSVSIYSDTTFTATFSTEYFVEINSSNGGSVTPADQWLTSDSVLQIEALPDSGYQFSEWIGTGSGSYTGTLNQVNINVLGPITQLAVFKITPIEAPSNLSGQIISNPASLQLFWLDNSENELGFIIERENQTGDAFIIVDSVAANITDYLDSNVSYITYNYRVKAFNSLTVSEYSDTLQIQIPVELTNFSVNISDNGICLTWNTATETNNRGFEVQKKTRNQDWASVGFMNGCGTTTEYQSYSFIDKNINFKEFSIDYRLKQIDFNGNFSYSNIINIHIDPVMIDYKLDQNYPNPFNPTTKIRFQIPDASEVSIFIYNVLGKKIKSLFSGYKESGYYEIEFDGSEYPSGVYIYKFSSPVFSSIKK